MEISENMRSKNRTEKTAKKKKRKKKHYLLRLILVALICVGAYLALHIDYFNVTGIAVVGNSEISDEAIIELSKLEPGNNLFDIQPILVERRIKKNLYIESVDVDRKLPDKIEIHVKERSGKAQFAMDGKYVVADNEGMVLEVTPEARKVTLVEGVAVTEAVVKENIQVRKKDEREYQRLMELIRVTEENDLYFKKVRINGNDAELYVYDKLLCRGRYENVMETIKSGALKAVVYDLYQKGTESGIINISSNNYCSFTP